MYKALESKAHMFDFVTCWSHWFLFIITFWPSQWFDLNESIVAGARLAVLSTSIFGTSILVARGYDCLPYIKHELYLHDPALVMPFFDSLPVILTIDTLWHGFPFWIVLNSRPLDPESVNVVHALLTVGTLGGAFILFEKFRGIDDPAVTYGLKGINRGTPEVLTGIALTSCSFYSAAVDPISFLSGWNQLVASVITLSSANQQRVASSLALGGFYFMILIFGRLPGSGAESETFANLFYNAIEQLKEMHRNHQLRTLWFVDSRKEGTGSRVTGRIVSSRSRSRSKRSSTSSATPKKSATKKDRDTRTTPRSSSRRRKV
ncbi:hypothetical protein TrRE_jg5918 [Triparma retinervis]|uniref:Uncharacterized protein n=1 Tax=Triparma retinervis TaxID=2557542 RepID=A0A9W6ZD21_9STRA|nr:hypothetical protein TrRE_jg5918 [Triparma retinervis]